MALTNDVRLIGNCAEEPVKISTKPGKYIVKVCVYTRHWWRDMGELKEKKVPHQCLFFGNNAKRAIKFLQKGTHIHLHGVIDYYKHESPKVSNDSSLRIIVEEFTVSDRIMISKEMYQNLFPSQEPNRVELSKQRYEMENFDEELARIENWSKNNKIQGKHHE